jgi:hypothetical protein
MTTSRVESEINSCMTRRWSALRLAQNGMQRGDYGHSQFAQECQDVTARRPAVNAELVLQADDVHVADVEEIRGAQIGRQVLLLNLEANHFRVFVATFDVVDRHRETLALRMRGRDGRKQVGSERSDAALARQMVADKAILRTLEVSFMWREWVSKFIRLSLNAWILRYSGCHMASSTCCTMSANFDAGQTFGDRGFGDRHGDGQGTLRKSSICGSSDAPGKANGNQAGYRVGRGGEHVVADQAGARYDRAQTKSGIQHGVVHLADNIGHSPVSDGRKRNCRWRSERAHRSRQSDRPAWLRPWALDWKAER